MPEIACVGYKVVLPLGMKFELDLNNRPALLKQREELRRMTEIVELALKGLNGGEDRTASTSTVATTIDSDAVFLVLQRRFTIANVMAAMATDDRKAASRIILKWIAEDKAKIKEPGKARRATIYEKIV